QKEGQDQQAGERGNDQDEAAHDKAQHGSSSSPVAAGAGGSQSPGPPGPGAPTAGGSSMPHGPHRRFTGRQLAYCSSIQRISPPEPTGEKRKPLTRSVSPRISTVL